METTSKTKLIDIIINDNNGYITRKDVNRYGIPSAVLSKYVKKHNLVKYGTGFYALKEWIQDDYLIFQYEYPKLIYSFYSAQFLNNLGDYNPPFLEVTAPKNYRPFPLPKEGVRLHTDTKDPVYNLGIIEIQTMFGNKVKAYNAEKTICDFVKNRSKLDSESFVKCLHFYKRRKDKNIKLLFEYSKIMNIEKEVFSLMEVVLN